MTPAEREPMSTTAERARYFPQRPPALPGEDHDTYTNRLTGALGEDQVPYDHPRNRQCSIGYHDECSDPAGARCKCPCHTGRGQSGDARDGSSGS